MIDVAIAKLSKQRSAMSLASHIEIVLMALYIPSLQAVFWNDHDLIKPIREDKSCRQGFLQRFADVFSFLTKFCSKSTHTILICIITTGRIWLKIYKSEQQMSKSF